MPARSMPTLAGTFGAGAAEMAAGIHGRPRAPATAMRMIERRNAVIRPPGRLGTPRAPSILGDPPARRGDEPDLDPQTSQHVDESIGAEEVDAAAQQVADSRLADSKQLGGLSLFQAQRPKRLLEPDHEVGAHQEVLRFARRESEVAKYISAGASYASLGPACHRHRLVACRLVQPLADCGVSSKQERLGIRALSANLERAKILVPRPLRRVRFRFTPELELIEIVGRDLALAQTLEKMIAESLRQAAPLDLGHYSPKVRRPSSSFSCACSAESFARVNRSASSKKRALSFSFASNPDSISSTSTWF